MNGTLHHVTVQQFAQMLMAEARRRRKLSAVRTKYIIGAVTAAEAAGYNRFYYTMWESGSRVPTLRQALDCLQAMAQLAC